MHNADTPSHGLPLTLLILPPPCPRECTHTHRHTHTHRALLCISVYCGTRETFTQHTPIHPCHIPDLSKCPHSPSIAPNAQNLPPNLLRHTESQPVSPPTQPHGDPRSPAPSSKHGQSLKLHHQTGHGPPPSALAPKSTHTCPPPPGLPLQQDPLSPIMTFTVPKHFALTGPFLCKGIQDYIL